MKIGEIYEKIPNERRSHAIKSASFYANKSVGNNIAANGFVVIQSIFEGVMYGNERH
jgi:hypothetical protein